MEFYSLRRLLWCSSLSICTWVSRKKERKKEEEQRDPFKETFQKFHMVFLLPSHWPELGCRDRKLRSGHTGALNEIGVLLLNE